MFFDAIYRSNLFYILRLICKEKKSQVVSCLNRLIANFHNIKFLLFLDVNGLNINDQNNKLNCVKGKI